LNLSVASPKPGLIVVEGQIPVDTTQALQTYFVQYPPSFARTLFIEALQREGIAVTAAPTGKNPDGRLPAEGSYREGQLVAVHRSLPFAENIKLILKLSQNQHADTLIFLLALKSGQRAFEEGMRAILPFLQKAGLDDNAVSLADGRGNEPGALFTPQVVTQLLLYMAKQPHFPVYHDALPALGVDGTEIDAVPPTSPIKGRAFAKSGTYVVADLLHFRPFQTSQGLVGYVPSQSGRELAYALYVNNLPLNQTNDVFEQDKDVAKIIEVIYRSN
jgi:D-alanyl-D-alanine carboxypeptidase/D-alanyl-D-alanine-endopeptidase (penicillin-binding protein 4)